MAKVRAKFRVRKRYSVEKDKYKIRTFIFPELPKSDFHEYYKPVDTTALIKIIEGMIDEEFPDTCNKLLWLEIIRPKEGESE